MIVVSEILCGRTASTHLCLATKLRHGLAGILSALALSVGAKRDSGGLRVSGSVSD